MSTSMKRPQSIPHAGFMARNPAWGIDWGRFIDVDIRNYDGTPDDQKKRLQFAYRIDTSLVNPLGDLPPAVASNPSSLAQRNLERAWRLGLPSGQSVARTPCASSRSPTRTSSSGRPS